MLKQNVMLCVKLHMIDNDRFHKLEALFRFIYINSFVAYKKF